MEVTVQEQVLLAAIRKAFADKNFDTASIIGEATFCSELMVAIESAIPGCRWQSRRLRLRANGGLRDAILRPVFERLAEQHFVIDERGWWYVKQESQEGVTHV